MAREDMYSGMSLPAPGSQDPSDKYTINRGDTLTKIASRHLGANANPKDIQAMIQRIAKENGIQDVNRIQAGASLRMPANAGMVPTAPEPGAPPPFDESLAGAPRPGMPLPSMPPAPMPSPTTPPVARQISPPAPGGMSVSVSPDVMDRMMQQGPYAVEEQPPPASIYPPPQPSIFPPAMSMPPGVLKYGGGGGGGGDMGLGINPEYVGETPLGAKTREAKKKKRKVK